MAQIPILLISSAVFYLLTFVSGLIVSVAIGLAKGGFDGNCPLYMTFEGIRGRIVPSSFGSATTCNYVIYFPVVGLVLYPFVMLVFYLYVIARVFTGQDDAIELIKKIPILVINGVIILFLLVTSGILTAGRSATCSSFISITLVSPIVHCHDLGSVAWQNSAFDTTKVVTQMVLAEVTAWICHIWLIILIVPTLVEMWKNYRQPSQN